MMAFVIAFITAIVAAYLTIQFVQWKEFTSTPDVSRYVVRVQNPVYPQEDMTLSVNLRQHICGA